MKPFVAWMWFQLVIYVATTTIALVMVYADREEVNKLCNIQATPSERDNCISSLNTVDSKAWKISTGIGIIIVVWVQICECRFAFQRALGLIAYYRWYRYFETLLA